jgi:putative ABC transport system permease protein
VAAQALKLQPGNTVSIKGKDWNVAGILTETGSNDDYEIFLPLAGLQTMFDKQGIISSIDVRALCNACPVELIATAINNELTGLRAVAVKQVASAEMGMLEKINRMMLALGGVTLIVGGFGVANTMMTSVQERTKDLGIMRAVGASRSQITKVLIYEAVIVGIAGGVLGYGAGTLLAYAMGPIILEGTQMSFALNYFPVSVALAIFIAVVATLYPALRATRIKVSDSFRAI